jgi:hypothetical protein
LKKSLPKKGIAYKNLLLYRNGQPLNLFVSAAYEETYALAERRIYDVMCKKLDEFMNMSDYNWVAAEADINPSFFLAGISNLFHFQRYGVIHYCFGRNDFVSIAKQHEGSDVS